MLDVDYLYRSPNGGRGCRRKPTRPKVKVDMMLNNIEGCQRLDNWRPGGIDSPNKYLEAVVWRSSQSWLLLILENQA